MVPTVHASVLALVTSPREFDRKQVRVVGYVVSQLEVWAVFNCEVDCRSGVTNNAVWLETYGTSYERVNQTYAIVEGTFDASSHGHLGMWSGTIRNITRLEQVSAEPSERLT